MQRLPRGDQIWTDIYFFYEKVSLWNFESNPVVNISERISLGYATK